MNTQFSNILVSGVQCPDGFEAFAFVLCGMLVQHCQTIFFLGGFQHFRRRFPPGVEK